MYLFLSKQGIVWLNRSPPERKGAGMKMYGLYGQMDLSDRIAIEAGISKGDSFRKIGELLHRHPTTIAHEVKTNRTWIHGCYAYNKDCRYVRMSHEHHVCGDTDCESNCCRCLKYDCTKTCMRYVSSACHQCEKPPYVCNRCNSKKLCQKGKYIYSAKYAEDAVSRRRSDSRRGIRVTEEQLRRMDALVSKLVRKGQPLTHIYAEHAEELPVSLRSLYTYIDDGRLTIRNIDLRRKTGYKPRKKKYSDVGVDSAQEYRKGRTYTDFTNGNYADAEVVEMDTVKGILKKAKRLLTLIFRKNDIMLLFLLPDGKAESVKRVFDFLEAGLGTEVFQRLFPVILTDNGSEFKRPDDLELTEYYEYRTRLYYCDPMAFWQKPHIEKNHEYIRYAIPKGKSLNPYTQEDMTLLMNHINSTRRPSLNHRAPYELIEETDSDMLSLWNLMKMHIIPPDDVHLSPDMFTFNR